MPLFPRPQPQTNGPKPRPRAALVTFRSFEMHARRESKALADQGYDVDIICLRRDGEDRTDTDGPVRFTRLAIPKTRGSLVRYALSYGSWFASGAALLTMRHLRRRYDLIQVTSLPDHQIFAAAIPKLLGAKTVLFLKEPTSELFHTLYGNDSLTKALRWIEMKAIDFADLTFAVTDQHRQGYVDRGADADRIEVVVNCTPQSALRPPKQARALANVSDNDITMICPGTIEARWGHECIIRALALAIEEVPNLRLIITGEGSLVDPLLELVDELGLADNVSFEGWVTLDRLEHLFNEADIGLTAQQASPYSHLVHTGKMYEYMMFGIPCISSRLDSTASYFGEDTVTYFEPDDCVDLSRAMIKLARDPELRRIQAEKAARAFEPYDWTHQRGIYLDAVSDLVESSSSS